MQHQGLGWTGASWGFSFRVNSKVVLTLGMLTGISNCIVYKENI